MQSLLPANQHIMLFYCGSRLLFLITSASNSRCLILRRSFMFQQNLVCLLISCCIYVGMCCSKLLEYIAIYVCIANTPNILYVLHSMLLHTKFQGHALCVLTFLQHTSSGTYFKFPFYILNTPLSGSCIYSGIKERLMSRIFVYSKIQIG